MENINETRNRMGFSLKKNRSFVCVIPAVIFSQSAFAGIGGAAINFGLGPVSAGTAMSLSPFLADPMAVYYNPASLAGAKANELSLIGHRADSELKVRSISGNELPAHGENRVSDAYSELAVLGVNLPVNFVGSKKPEYFFGFNLGVDNYGRNFLPFNDSTSTEGQFLRYQSEPLYIGLGVAKSDVIKGVDIGVGSRITLNATASLDATSDLAGNTDSESVTMKAAPKFSINFGVNADVEKMLCNSSECKLPLFDSTSIAGFWRDESYWGVGVKANLVVPGLIPEPGLNVKLNTIDSYQPEVIGVSIKKTFNKKIQTVLTLEEQKWSKLNSLYSNDTVRDQAELEFKDVYIPRLGFYYSATEVVSIFAGMSFEKSPLTGKQSPDVNAFDSDKMVYGVGTNISLNDAIGAGKSVQFALALQYQKLKEREFELINVNSPMYPNPYETVKIDGDALTLSASVTATF